MSEIVLLAASGALPYRPALAHPPIGGPGAALTMAALPEGHVLQLLVAPSAGDVAGRLAAIGDGSRFALRPLSPGHWFVVGDARLTPTAVAEKADAVVDIAHLSDQSGGRVRIALAGRSAETVLSRGIAVDPARAAFPVGRSAQTLFGHIGIHLTRVAEDGFEMMVLRSFAESLWAELATLGVSHFRGV